jgi:hypothetical protein
MNNNRQDERALQAGCKGVFSTNSYITFGDKRWRLPLPAVALMLVAASQRAHDWRGSIVGLPVKL